MTRSLLLREVVSMFRQGTLTKQEFTSCINMLNKKVHPRVLHKRICLGTI